MMGHKAWWELFILFALSFLGLALRHPAILILAVPLAWHLVVGLAFSPPDPRNVLLVRRTVAPRRLVEGGTVRVRVEVENRGKVKLDLSVRDGPYPGFSVVGGKAEKTALLPPGQSLVLSYEARPARGLYSLAAVTVEVRDPLGLVPQKLEVPCSEEVLVLPRYEDLTRLELGARRTLTMPGTIRAKRGGRGSEFYGVREYRPGEEMRRLAWKVLARRDELAVVEFEEERVAEVAVVLDVRARAYRGLPSALFDQAVRAAATLSQFYLRQGHRVALLKYGAHLDWVFPGYGRRHGERILRELAKARLGESEVFGELGLLPTRLLPAGSLLLLVSPLVPGDEEALGELVARGYRVAVILPDPGHEAPPGSPTILAEISAKILALERWVLLRRLRRGRVLVVVWDVRRPLAPLLWRIRPVMYA